MQIGKWWSLLALAGLLACSSDENAVIDGGTGGAIADAGVADILAVDTTSDGGTCDDCGSPRFTGDCSAQETACLADAGCASIRNCVFSGVNGSMPCALDPTGPACVESCVAETCTGDPSVALYQALDHCAYCSTCAAACSAYCGAFPDAAIACRDH
jgi:hypothetical protein